jgi:hypothetical protein
MKKVIYVCNGCGRTIEGNPETIAFGIRDLESGKARSDDARNQKCNTGDMDFCPECVIRVEAFLKNLHEIIAEEEKREPETERNRSAEAEKEATKSVRSIRKTVTEMLKSGTRDKDILKAFPEGQQEEVKKEITECRERIETQLLEKICGKRPKISKITN